MTVEFLVLYLVSICFIYFYLNHISPEYKWLNFILALFWPVTTIFTVALGVFIKRNHKDKKE